MCSETSQGCSCTPIFIHSMWRTGGTYLWSKFRSDCCYRAYYEPFHEALLSMADPKTSTETQVLASTPFVRHPSLNAPYFVEYPFRSEGGVEFFDRSFPYARYCLDEQSSHECLQRYLTHLMAFANDKQQVPVFKFTRSLLRSRWLAARYRSRNLLVLRKPLDVWRSFRDQGMYYMTAVCQIISVNYAHPLLAQLVSAYDIPHGDEIMVGNEWRVCREYAVNNWLDLYGIFYQFYLITCIYNLELADCVVDMNTLSECTQGRDRTARRLADLGIRMSFDDAAMPAHTDLSRSEREWLSHEADLRKKVAAGVQRHLRLSQATLNAHHEYLSPYFRGVLAEFAL